MKEEAGWDPKRACRHPDFYSGSVASFCQEDLIASQGLGRVFLLVTQVLPGENDGLLSI